MSTNPIEAPSRQAEPLLRVVVWCLGWMIATRLGLEAIGLAARGAFEGKLAFDYVWVYADRAWLDIWGVWDTGWYLDIVRHGYDAAPKSSGPVAGQANWAFFPAYPLLAAAIGGVTGLGAFPAMVGLSNLCFTLALVLLWREAESLFGASAARAAVVLLCVVPGSYVFSSGYTESLFLLLVLATMALARHEWWVLAGAAAAGAALTRNLGVCLVVPLAVLAWQALGPTLLARCRQVGVRVWLMTDREGQAVALALVLPVAALAGFMAFLWVRTGDPLAFVSIQAAWGRQIDSPFATLLAPVVGPGGLTATRTAAWVTAVLALGLAAVMAAWRSWALAALAGLLLLIPLSAGLESVMRYVIVVYPVFLAAGALLGRRPAWLTLLSSVLALLNGFYMACWALGLPNVI